MKILIIPIILILAGCSTNNISESTKNKPSIQMENKAIEGCKSDDPLCLFDGSKEKGKPIPGCPEDDPLCLFE